MVSRVIIAVLVANVLVCAEVVAAKDCPGLSTSVGHLCISHVSTTKSNFTDAQETCKNQNSALILPLTQLQCEDVANFIDNTVGNDIWINLNDQDVDSQFMMESGLNFEAEFFDNWAIGEPRLSATENCVSLFNGTFQTNPQVKCKHPFIAHGDMCLTTLPPAKRSVNSAEVDCETIGGFLPHAFNLEDNKMLKSYLSKRYSRNGAKKWFGPLLGSRRFNGTNIFLNPFNHSVVTYMNWRSGEPNNKNEVEDCTAMHHTSSVVFTANDIPCQITSTTKVAFCQMAAECLVPVISYGVATINSTSREVGVSCMKNYMAQGSFPAYCGVKGLMPADFNVTCEFLKCEDVQISNGKPLYSKAALQMPGTNRKFVCDSGYQLNETNTNDVCVTDDSDSKARWSHNTPVCQKSCGTTFVEHGTVQYSDGAGHHGSQMTIECEPGYFTSMTTTHCMDGIWEDVLGCIGFTSRCITGFNINQLGNSNQRCPIHIASADTLYVGSSCYWMTQNSESWENSFDQCIADGGKLAPGTGSDLWQDQLFPFINKQNIQIWVNTRQVADVIYEFESATAQKRLSSYMPKYSNINNWSNGCFYAKSDGTVELDLCSETHRALCVREQPWAKYKTKKNMRMSGAMVLDSTMATSQIHCGMQCTRTTDCLGINYNPLTGVCELLDRKYLDNEDLLEVAIGWEIGYKIY